MSAREFYRGLRLASLRRQRWRMSADAGKNDLTMFDIIVAHLQNTTVGLVPSVPDVSNPPGAAVQTTPASQPTGLADASGRVNLLLGSNVPTGDWPPNPASTPIYLRWPVIAGVNKTRKFGIALWVRPASTNHYNPLFVMNPASGNARALMALNRIDEALPGGIYLFLASDGATSRNAQTPEGIIRRTRYSFVTLEYDADAATDAERVVITVDLVPQTLLFGTANNTFQNGLRTAVGDVLLFTLTTIINDYVGQISADIYFLGEKMTGAVLGLLTSAGRAELAGLTPPVQPVYTPTELYGLSAHWSARGSTVASAPQRITRGTNAGAMAQSTPLRQPVLLTLSNGQEVFAFDGVNTDLKVPVTSSLKPALTSAYWAFHVRLGVPVNTAQTIYSEWSTGGASIGERMMLQSDALNNLVVSIATNSSLFFSNSYAIPLVTQQNGMWLEIIFKGAESTAANRIRLYVDGVEVTRLANTGTLATTLQAGDAVDYYLGSLTGAANRQMWLAHQYIGRDIPSTVERNDLRLFEAPAWVVAVPPIVASLVAHWSASLGATTNELPNRAQGSIGSQIQINSLRRPTRYTLANAVPYMSFTGYAAMSTGAVPALKATGPQRYWAWHLRKLDLSRTIATFYSEGTARRFALTFNSGTLSVWVGSVANDYAIPIATQRAGLWLEVLFDGAEVAAADRIRVYVDGAELTRAASGALPATLPPSSMSDFNWNTENFTPSANFDVAHMYLVAAKPTAPERATMQAHEAPVWTLYPVPSLSSIVTAWLRSASSTVVDGCVTSLPDLLNGANPATAAGTARPMLAADSAGFATLVTTQATQVMTWPASANNIGAFARWGLACWLMAYQLSNNPVIYRNRNVTNVVEIALTATTLTVSIWNGATARVATYSGTPIPLYTACFLTVEFDGGQAVEADRIFVSVGNVKLTAVLSGATTVPAVLNTPDGASSLGIASAAFFKGRIGANLWVLKGAGAIAGGGLVTTAGRADLMAIEPMASDPVSVTGGAVSSWYRLAQGTITGAGYSSVPDALNPASPATMTVDATRPVPAMSANGLPILTCTSSGLLVPLNAATNDVNTWGFWCWTREFSFTAPAQTWFAVSGNLGPDSSLRRATINADNPNGPGRLMAQFYLSPSLSRLSYSANNVLTLNTWAFFTVEFDGSRSTEATKVTITKNGVPLVLTFVNSNGTPNDMPTTLQAATGSGSLFIQRSNDNLNPLKGQVGSSFGFMASKQAGATVGLLTTAGRNALMAIDAPKDDPSSFTESVIKSWYRVAGAVVTGSGVSSLPDMLSDTTPAVQTVDGQRPALTTSSNGLPVMLGIPGGAGSKALLMPIVTGSNNVVTTWGFATWMRRASTNSRNFFRSGANLSAAQPQTGDSMRFSHGATGSLDLSINTDSGGANYRQVFTGVVFPLLEWRFVTIEMNMPLTGEAAKLVITIDGVIQPLTYGGTAGALGTALQAMTASHILMNNSSVGTSPLDGLIGPNIYILGAKMTAATEGLLTPAARLQLMNYEAPA